MTEKNPSTNPSLIASLREGVGLVQMIFYKELRNRLTETKKDEKRNYLALLAGSITNEVFGTRNPEEKFARFVEENWGEIEQELLSLKDNHHFLCRHLTDALRIQVLCDHQEGSDSSETLTMAKGYGYLLEDREIPLPSTFMTLIRELGRQHNLIIPPVQISSAEDQSLQN